MLVTQAGAGRQEWGQVRGGQSSHLVFRFTAEGAPILVRTWECWESGRFVWEARGASTFAPQDVTQ